ncbi:glycosyltransferase family 2 protein [Desulfonatronovibrio hydrogenovorans]|uniref:glycosyltransferase family 2 protein n=1 Tax=Desulfonatronovibrio hydrogenovorans TaxID=53245 RepID=UPI001FC9711F|nr:cellulose synthase catalytic subunit [Desulfonatronovibrio hydrogenovorans]
MVRTVLFIIADYAWYDKIFGFFLLMAQVFVLTHGFGYFLNLFRVVNAEQQDSSEERLKSMELTEYPPVAIIVSSYKEPLHVVEDTLISFYNLTYPNKSIYFLDDTRYDLKGWDPEEARLYREQINDLCKRIGVNLFRRRWRGAKAGMINDFLSFLDGNPPEGFEFVTFDQAQQVNPGQEEYIIVFDADQNPFPDFVETLVSRMEANPTVAFIQTPQYYSNFEFNRVARASGLQQAVFYEYICEGKSMQDAMFCCGTNVIFRREALRDVGGFDESSVTEDFATSLKFHVKGWRSAYLNRVSAFGDGPEDLGGYFKQQFRWALGTVGLFRTIIARFLRNPLELPIYKWWEYMLSGTHYFVGWVLMILVISPCLFILFNIPTYFARPELYFVFYVPYIILTFSLFIWSLGQRHYSVSEVINGVLLQAICFPVYMKASFLAVLGYRGTFKTTPKGRSLALPMYALWAQIGLASLCLVAMVWAGMRIYFERELILALSVNAFWCFYHFLILSAAVYFNHPLEESRSDGQSLYQAG